MSDSPKRTRQPAVYWIGVGALVVSLGLLVPRIASTEEHGVVLATVVITVGVLGLVIAVFVWNIRRDMRAIAESFPNAIHIPITVGSELAEASQRVALALGDDDIRISRSTYAALAVDAKGVHVASDHSAEFGLIPADRVTVAGFGRSLLGYRTMSSVVLNVTTDDGDIDFAFVPMRLKGNPLRELTPGEFAALSAELTRALNGEPVSAGWKY